MDSCYIVPETRMNQLILVQGISVQLNFIIGIKIAAKYFIIGNSIKNHFGIYVNINFCVYFYLQNEPLKLRLV